MRRLGRPTLGVALAVIVIVFGLFVLLAELT